MMNYTGEPCPYCNKLFDHNDDIAVCPDCGTPHHRVCYHEHGHCANETLHAAAYDYGADRAKQREDQLILSGSRRCSACGRPLPKTGNFCNYCGKPFYPGDSDSPSSGGGKSVAARFFSRPQSDENNSSDYDHLSALREAEDETERRTRSFSDSAAKIKEFDGISIPDWKLYIGRNSDYYIRQFQLQQITGRNFSFMLSAMLFPGLYFLYRKVWLIAALAIISSAALYLPTVLLVLADGGYIALQNYSFWFSVYSVTRFLSFGANLFWGMFSLRIYRFFAARHLNILKTCSQSVNEFRHRLIKQSGPSLLSVVIFSVVAVSAVAVAKPDIITQFF